MTPSQAIKEQLIVLATISGKELNPLTLNAYADALSDLDPNAVLVALRDWLKTGRGFPYPADIRAKVMPELDDNDDAQTAVNLIIDSIGKDGYTNPERAEERMGPLACEVVKQSGGWKHICTLLTPQNETTVKAQLRDLAKTVSKRAKRGELDQAPELPAPSSEVNLLIQTTMKGIE